MMPQLSLLAVGRRVAAANLAATGDRLTVTRTTADTFGQVDAATGALVAGATVTVLTDAPCVVTSTTRGAGSDAARTVASGAWQDLDTVSVRFPADAPAIGPGDQAEIVTRDGDTRTGVVLGTLPAHGWYRRAVIELDQETV